MICNDVIIQIKTHLKITESSKLEVGGGVTQSVGEIVLNNQLGDRGTAPYDHLAELAWFCRAFRGDRVNASGQRRTVFHGMTDAALNKGKTVSIQIRDNNPVLRQRISTADVTEAEINTLHAQVKPGDAWQAIIGEVKGVRLQKTSLVAFKASGLTPIEGVTSVYDDGNALSENLAFDPITDDFDSFEIGAGFFIQDRATGRVRVHTEPVGEVTADVNGWNGEGYEDTHAGLFRAIHKKLGLAIDDDTILACIADDPHPCGFLLNGEEEALQVLTTIAESSGLLYGYDSQTGALWCHYPKWKDATKPIHHLTLEKDVQAKQDSRSKARHGADVSGQGDLKESVSVADPDTIKSRYLDSEIREIQTGYLDVAGLQARGHRFLALFGNRESSFWTLNPTIYPGEVARGDRVMVGDKEFLVVGTEYDFGKPKNQILKVWRPHE